MTGDLIVKGATLSGEFVEMIYKKVMFYNLKVKNVCVQNTYVRTYMHAGVCVHVYMYGSEVSPLYCNHSRQKDPSCHHD